MPKRKKKEEKTRIFLNICQEYEEMGKRKQQREQGEKNIEEILRRQEEV